MISAVRAALMRTRDEEGTLSIKMAACYTVWLQATLATTWDIYRNHRFMRASLERIEESGRKIRSLLGDEGC
jgi:hypothetical protein